MSSDSDRIPVDLQCSMPRCAQEAVDPTRTGALCEQHLAAVEQRADRDEKAGSTTAERGPREAFTAAIAYFSEQLDQQLPDGAEFAYDTPRKYLQRGRGWSDETISAKRLGYAPAGRTALLDHLMQRGYDREAILGTGLFWDDLTPIWRGRIVLPYLEDDRPAFAISRTIGHPEDDAGDYGDGPAKYHKIPVSRDAVCLEEPIYGLETVREGEPVLITEGIADAITAHAAGYPCVSPVTTQFKHADRERLLEELTERDVPRVYIVQDAERATSSLDDNDRLMIEQFGEGLRGAIATASALADQGIDARIGELPRPGLEKVDVDDYLQEWADGDLTPILASAAPVEQHPAYDPKQVAIDAAVRDDHHRGDHSDHDAPGDRGDGDRSALFDLDIRDVTGLSWDYRGTNPLGHHGDSTNYFVLEQSPGVAFDYKSKTAYSALTYLLCEAGERSPSSPNGALDDDEILAAWTHAKREGLLAEDDPIPRRGLLAVAIDAGLCGREDIEDGWKLPLDAYNGALELIEDEHGLDPGRPPIAPASAPRGSGAGARALGAEQFIEECDPPLTADAEPIDVDARREEMTGAAYDRFIEHDGLSIGADPPGVGKTTSYAIGAAERDRPHVVALPKHENCREFQLDDAKPDGYFHLKGAAQPVGDACMDAMIADSDCPEHGHPSNCSTMCPVYELARDDSIRQRFDALAGSRGVQKAHSVLGLHQEDWHGEICDWQEQWDVLDGADRVVTVRNYITLKSIREHGDILLDDSSGGFVEETTVSIEDLARCRQVCGRFAQIAGSWRTVHDLATLAEFIDELLDMLTSGEGELGAVDPPSFREREYVGEKGQWTHVRTAPDDVGHLAERLAQVKLFYEETIIDRMRRDEWDGTPLCLDAVFGALAAVTTGETANACRIAAGVDVSLDNCPVCKQSLTSRQGARLCTECGWHEADDPLTNSNSSPARIDVDVKTDRGGTVHGLICRRLPGTEQLPDVEDVLVLDATPRKAVYAGVFGVDPETVLIEGDDAYSLPNATVTQFVNGAYHRSTLEESSAARRRIQHALEKIDAMHNDVIYVTINKSRALFDWPGTDPDEVLYYYALRGLDAGRDADAIVLVGAPHPDESDLRAEGRLLAIDNPTVRSGGRELSTRDDDATGPPVYRKLNYVDNDGRGREVAAKAYTGITGELFDARHGDEIEQAAHRIRPLLATEDETKHIYLLTNVPTELPVDRLTTFDAFLDPLGSAVDVRDSALELLEAMVDAARDEQNNAPYVTDGGLLSIGGTGSEWLDAAERTGLDISQQTVSRALDDLRNAGLVEKGTYKQRRGRLQTLTPLGASVASVRR